jgi:hypothetical protein
MRKAEATESGWRAAGYCGLEHPEGKAWCSKPPNHAGRRHVDYYNGRKSLGDATGTEWDE